MKLPNSPLTSPTNLSLLILCFVFFNLNAQQIAFPTAKGAGAYASGGRGGQVIHVTTLDWEGPGSLKEAIQTPGPRTIVFDVSGEIDATVQGDFENIIYGSAFNDITIAGQTAPNGGISVRTTSFRFANVDNVIIRFIRFRNALGQTNTDAIWLWGGHNTVLDHCTFSHGADEGIDLSDSIGSMGNITVQNCFFQDSKTGLIMGVDDVDGDFTMVNNLFSSISHRFPNPKGDGHYDIINNVVYNWKNRLIRITGEGTYNVMNNYYKGAANGIHRPGWFINYDISPSFLQKLQTQANDDPLIYASGSQIYNQRTPQADDSDMWTIFNGSHLTVNDPVPSQYFTSTQFPLVGYNYEIKPADEAYNDILDNVGSDKTLNADGSINRYQDDKDAADILMVINDTYEGGFFDYASAIPYPIIPQNVRPNDFYSSNPHIPEIWFQANVPEGQNHNDMAPSGYTWLEEYLNGVDASFVAIGVESVEVTPDVVELQISNSVQLTSIVIPSNATNINGVWSSSDDSIASVDGNGLVTPLSIGQVTITFTTTDGGYTDTSEITVLPEALQASAGDDQQICEGESITLTASGGTSYVWSTGETTEIIEVTLEETTTYTVTVSDDFEQSEDASVTVTVNELPIANAGEDQTICIGESAIVTATGGTSYLWNTGETTALIEVNPEVETIYSVEVSSNGCSSTDEVAIFVNESPTITVTEDLVIVEGESTTLSASGSDNYEWNTGEFTESIIVNPTTTTTYSVSTIGSNGCISSVTTTITVVPPIVATASEDVTVCSGDAVTLTAFGGSTYIWSTGDLGSELIVNPTETTTYIVTAQDDYGYTDIDEVTIFVNELPTITVEDDLFVMIGNSITITANGGISYLWSTGETTAEITVSPQITTAYTLTGYAENGCQSTIDVLVTVVDLLSANAGEDVVICLGESITLHASGGITYTWNTGDTGAHPTFTPIETTTYSVTVTDGFGNSDNDEVTITVNPVPVAIASEDITICQNESVTLTAEGGDSYLWNTGDTTETISVNPNEDTTYTVEVLTNGCSDTDSVTVFVLPIPNVILSDDIVIITGNSTTLEVSGGDSYLWSTGDTSETLVVNPTETTTFSVTAFSTNGCETTDEVIVTVIPEVIADAGDDVSICIGESVTLNATGSNNFSWSSGETSASITLSPTETTTYTVTVSDDYGYSDTASITVTVNELPNLMISENIVIFDGESTELAVNGAETYLWNTGDISSTIIVNPIETTNYTVTGYSINGCEITAEVLVTVIPEVIANTGDDVSICLGESVTLNASGSTYFSWSSGETSASITVNPSETTTYTVTVSDDYGNSDSDSVTVTVNTLPNLTMSNDIVIFEGESTNLTVNGAETYLWNTGDTSNSITIDPIETTTYTVTGFSLSGCQAFAEVTVTVIPEVIANAGDDISICIGESVALNASGSTYFSWSSGETSASITLSPIETTTYTITVSDDYGNSDSDSVTVTVNELPNMTISDNVTIFEGESTSLSANGAETYLWNTDETTNSITVSPTETTSYIVTGTSEYGCQVIEEITVIVNPVVNANAGNDISICAGSNVTLNATGGTSYLWNTGQTTALISVTPTETTTYTVTATDDLGNSDSDTVTITVDQIPNITVSENITIYEGESTDLIVNGADIYIWNTSQTSSTITVNPNQTTVYTVIGYSANSCESEEMQVTVTVIPEVIANAGNDVSICIGESVTISGSGGSNYLWDTGETSASIVLNPTETTTYTVTVSDDFGNSDSDSITVTVNELPSITLSEDITIFEGESTNLIANGAETYLWNTGETSNSIVVNPTETTTYSVIGFSENGCESAEEVTVTVIPEVVANAGNDVSICIGESVTLSGSGGSNYSWDTGGTSASIVVTPTETTTYTVTVSDDFGNSDSNSVTVTVNELPSISLSEDITIFEGESTNLIANGAETYLWNTGETSNSVVVNPTETTTYSVTGFSASNCETIEEVTVTVLPEVIANAGNDVSICIGESVTLNGSGGSNYSWDTGGTSASIVVNPTETTTYTVTVSDDFGNSDSDSVTVTVNELPIITVSESITIIEGETTTLFVNGAESYLWNTGETSNSIEISPLQTTTYSVIGSTNFCSSVQSEIIVTVTPLFIASAGSDAYVCDNQTYDVVLTAGEGDSYLWSTGETSQTITVSPLSTSSYSVTVSNNGQEDSDDVIVYVDPSPEVVVANGNSVEILNGDFITLSASGANTYEWNNGATQPNIAVSPSITTTYEVRGYIGDCYDDKQVVVNVLQPVVADAGEDVLICLTDVTTLTATGGDEYVWSNGETTPAIQVSPEETTDYTVTVFNALDFDEATVRVEVDTNCIDQTANPSGIPKDFKFNVYPNPASGVVNFKFSGVVEVSDVHVFDVTGKLVQSTKISNENISTSTTKQIDISSLQTGVYFVKLIGEEKDITERLLVK